MKILLIYPKNTFNKGEEYFVTFPLGLGYLAASLEKAGHQVSVIDSVVEYPKPRPISKDLFYIGLNEEEMIRRIKEIKPDIIGINCSFSIMFQNVRNLAKSIKEKINIPIIIGGAHPSALPKDVIEEGFFDYILVGEAEDTIVQLVSAIENNKSIEHIDGLAFKKKGKLVINPKKNYIKDIDTIPWPARHLFPMKKYLYTKKSHAFYTKRKPYTTIITSRGCPQNCVFCSIHTIWGHFWRARSVKDVVDEIEHLNKKYGVKEIHFEDDNLALDKKRIISICKEIINRKIDISWTTPNGISANTLDDEVLNYMKKSGCYKLRIAPESGNDYVRNTLIRKNISSAKIKEVVRLMKKHKIEVSCFFVMGVPGETKKTVRDTINFAKELDIDDVSFAIATPYPGTEMYYDCIKKGYIEKTDSNFLKPKYATISTEFLKAEQLEKLRNRGYLEFQMSKLWRHPIKFLSSKENYRSINRYARFFFKNYVRKK